MPYKHAFERRTRIKVLKRALPIELVCLEVACEANIASIQYSHTTHGLINVKATAVGDFLSVSGLSHGCQLFNLSMPLIVSIFALIAENLALFTFLSEQTTPVS